MIHYLNPDYDCFYPAQEFQKNTVTYNRKQELWRKVDQSAKKIYIERNVPNLFFPSEIEESTGQPRLFTNYWVQINDINGNALGLIGLQFETKEYIKIIPFTVLEEPYNLSFINLYDKQMKTIWHWGCDDCLQDYTIAESLIREQYVAQGEKYI